MDSQLVQIQKWKRADGERVSRRGKVLHRQAVPWTAAVHSLLKRVKGVGFAAVIPAAVLFTAACSYQPNSDAATPPPSTTFWRETGSQFDTTDMSRAQGEIPFRIVMPTYVPKGDATQARLPQITGPLKAYQLNNKVEIQIFYMIDLGPGIAGIIRIYETNYPVFPPDSALNPGYHYVQTAGITMEEYQGSFAEGTGTILWFNQDGLYFQVGVYNFPSSDALKVAASLVS